MKHTINQNHNIKSIVTLLFILSLIVSCILVWINFGKLSFPLDRNEPGSVASVFVLTMMQNQESKAKSLASSEQWPQIDKWMDEHTPVKCPWPPFDTSMGYGVGSGLAHENSRVTSYSYNVSLPCPDYANYYCISVKDMILQKTDEGWKVIELGKIEEFYGDSIKREC